MTYIPEPGDWVLDEHGYQLVFEFDCLGKAYCRSICGNYYLKEYDNLREDGNNAERRKYQRETELKAKREIKKLFRSKQRK